jgi:hypothetical protein
VIEFLNSEKTLNDESTRTSATITNGSDSDSSISALKNVQKCSNDTSTTTTDWMSNRYASTKNIDTGAVQIENLHEIEISTATEFK